MNCPTCGHANEDGASFCEACKADLEMPAPATGDLAADTVDSNGPVELEPIPVDASSADLPPPMESTTEQPAVASGPPPLPVNLNSTVEQPPPGEAPTTDAPPGSGSGVSPKLIVVRGQKMDAQYPLFPGKNYLGRTDDKPVDIDLEDQEAPDRVWSSRQHAVINFDSGVLTIEDLNSLNGTFVNRSRVHPGQAKELKENDVVQVGTVHLKLVMG